MPAPDSILKLVQRFSEQKDTYKSSGYNETQTRRDFIDPFFKALGWDLENENDYAEAYRDVIHEDLVLVGNAKKAPDYSFRVGGSRKFFVEAKKPSIPIGRDPKPAFQLRRYGWSAKLPISILTNFDELAVYDCTHKPDEAHTATKARLHHYKYTDYAAKWDEIAELFSKPAVYKGSFDRFAAGKKKGGTTVDGAFLSEIEAWRQGLASNILRNNVISPRELNLSVQLTIDRIIFLRICEDRGIEDYERLLKVSKGKAVYQQLGSIFKDADDKYNSGLFHFNPNEKHATPADTLTLKLKIDDAPLREIISSLYPPNPYEFSVIPADILGQVYERFLGKVIQVKGKIATIKEKPEVKKAGGVFYTPSFIVNYIASHTVDKELRGKTPKQVEKIKIMDPACGSGSFLIVAYQRLLDWHLAYYMANGGPTKFKKELHQTTKGTYRLTTQVRKSILINNIFGVDVDPQAVEVTKLSLLLKVLEGESGEAIGKNLSLFHERALPDLGDNIKCGNSLVESDFYAQEALAEITEEEEQCLNVFDWKSAFPKIFTKGGFDIVIGNPPYLGGREWSKDNRATFGYFMTKYATLEYQFDMYAVFIEQAVKILKVGGTLSFITPNTWMNNQSNLKLRKFLLGATHFQRILDCSKIRVFEDATVLTVVFIAAKGKSKDRTCIDFLTAVDRPPIERQSILQSAWQEHEAAVININMNSSDKTILAKIEDKSTRLDALAKIKFGIKIYETGKGSPPQTAEDAKKRKFEASSKLDNTYRPYLEGKDISPYSINYRGRWLKYGKNLAAPRSSDLFVGERILCRRITGKTLICAYTDEGYVTSQLLQIIKPHNPADAKFLLGLLSSKLIYFYFSKKYNRTGDKAFPEIRIYELCAMPVKKQASIRKAVVAFVDRLLALKSLDGPQAAGIKEGIDKLICRLYGLTSDEIAFVEDVAIQE
jgi:hypothetical protein